MSFSGASLINEALAVFNELAGLPEILVFRYEKPQIWRLFPLEEVSDLVGRAKARVFKSDEDLEMEEYLKWDAAIIL